MSTETKNPTQENFYLNLQTAIEIGREMILPRPQDILLTYVERYYDGGKIVPINIHKSAAKGADLISYCEYNSGGKHDAKEMAGACLPKKTKGDRILVGKGLLQEDTEWADNDPYETAGGYRGGIARAGAECNVWLSYDYTGFLLEIEAPVSITEDHYNNNFYGVSTGGGTKTFEEGTKTEAQMIVACDTMHIFGSNLGEDYVVDYDRVINFVLLQEKENNKAGERIR